MNYIKYILLCGLSGISTYVLATGPGAYFGLQVGQTSLSAKDYYVNTGLPTGVCDMNHPQTCVTTPTKVKPTSTGIGERLYFGIQMNRIAGIEIGATNYAPAVYDPKIPESFEPALRAFSLDIVGKLMYSLSSFTVFGKFGGAGTRQTATGALTEVALHGRELNQVPKAANSAHLMAAVGLSWDLTPNWVFDITASEIFQGSNFPGARFYGLGISYHWVDLYCGQFLC